MNLEFELRLREIVSGGLQKLGAMSDRTFDRIDNSIKGTQSYLDKLGEERKLRVDTSDLDAAHGKIKELTSTWDVMRGTMLGEMAFRGIDMAARKIMDIGHEMFNAGADAEQQIIGLRTFVGKDRAQGIYNDIQRSSALTPYTTKDILPGMLQLVATGMTPERAKKDMWSLMNALSATGNAGDPFALQLGEGHLAQIASQGSVDARFMNEFQRTLHIPMTRLLSDYMNVPMKTISEWQHGRELSKHVTYDTFVGALEKAAKAGGMFADALENQSQTIKGKLSTIEDWWNVAMVKAELDPKVHDNVIAIEDKLINLLTDPKNVELLTNAATEVTTDMLRLIDWMEHNTDAIKTSIHTMERLIEVMGVLKLLQIGANTVGGFMGGAAAGMEGSIIAGMTRNSMAGWAGIGAGALSEAVGISIGTMGGIAAIIGASALAAYELYEAHMHKDENTKWEKEHPEAYGRAGYSEAVVPKDGAIPTPAVPGWVDWKDKDMKKEKADKNVYEAAQDISDNIVGGGQKSVVMNFNAPLYKVDKQTFQKIDDQIKDWEPKVKEAMKRILYSVPGSPYGG